MKRFPSTRVLPLLAAFALAIPCLPSASARVEGSGKIVTEKREVSGINTVELQGFGDLEIVQDGTEGLTLTGEDNILPLISTEVDSKGVLHIGFKRNESIATHEKLRMNLAVKVLAGLTLSGSSNVHTKELKGKDDGNFSVELAGSGNVSVDKLAAGTLKLELAGSGDVKVAGEVSDQKIEIAGSGGYEGKDLKSKTATVSVSGSGDVEIWATDKLDVSINGSGDVDYRGKPELKKSVSGSGSVGPLDEK